jgi:N-acyl-phosphatidylethanolamine-hydrolysing phospholipase D
MTRPPHHRPDGRFRSPWPEAAGDDALRARFWRVAREWMTTKHAPDPGPEQLHAGTPFIRHPVLDKSAVRVTWVGHTTFLLQLPGLNVLTDPVWSNRVSPVPFTGPRRFVPPAPALDALPPIHAVLLSHDHFDHLDRATVRALHRRHGDALTWFTPLGYQTWFGRMGIERVVELDWWESTAAPGGRFAFHATPARHWTRRTPWGTNARLWASWAILPRQLNARGEQADTSAGTDPGQGPRVFFGGDSGYASCFSEIGARLGPFDLSLIPIGAYAPRWFMAASHMDPDEAVQVYRDLGGSGAFVPSHWGTFRLTFEDPLEPPLRARSAWTGAGLPPADLHVLRHGETVEIEASGAGEPDA